MTPAPSWPTRGRLRRVSGADGGEVGPLLPGPAMLTPEARVPALRLREGGHARLAGQLVGSKLRKSPPKELCGATVYDLPTPCWQLALPV